MPISDLCTKNFNCIEQNETLSKAAQLMKKRHTGGLVVVDSNGSKKPVGVITDRDIALCLVADNLPASTKVCDVMSTDIVKVTGEKGIAEVVDRMENHGVRRMVIVDSAGNACGLVSADDILQLVAREIYGLGRLVQRQSQKEKGQRLASVTM